MQGETEKEAKKDTSVGLFPEMSQGGEGLTQHTPFPMESHPSGDQPTPQHTHTSPTEGRPFEDVHLFKPYAGGGGGGGTLTHFRWGRGEEDGAAANLSLPAEEEEEEIVR